MIAAIYARKSTDQAVADDQKSVARQVAHSREYAARKGWMVDEACVYIDDGISGAEFANRPGFVRLMAALKPQAPFQVLIMSEESRLGREAIETAYALKQLVVAGVRVFFYLEDRERTLDSPTDKILMSLTAYADELEREKARQRVTDAMVRKAKAGHVTGGRVFGYDNLEILGPSGERSHVERRINEGEAAVVRGIFVMAAEGIGQKRIAQHLNAEAALAPRAQRGRPTAWAPSSVHEVLFRALYRGEIVWNKTRKRNRWGETRVADRPAGEWMHIAAPELAIVSDDLWAAAHRRIAESRERHQAGTPHARGGRPRATAPRFLLTGFARCSCCNGGMHVRSRQHGVPGKRQRVFLYACTSHFNRGAGVCRNDLLVRMDAVDRAVMDAIADILTPDLVDVVIAGVHELVRPGGAMQDPREQLAEELAAVDAQLENLTDAIAMGKGSMPALVRRLEAAEQRRHELAGRLEAADAGLPMRRFDWTALERQARHKLADWRRLLTRQVTEGRELLSAILPKPIAFTPFREADGSGYRFSGAAAIGGLLCGLVDVIARPPRSTALGMASPGAPEPEPVLPTLHIPFDGEVRCHRAA